MEDGIVIDCDPDSMTIDFDTECDLNDTAFYDMLDVIKDHRVLVWKKNPLNQCFG